MHHVYLMPLEPEEGIGSPGLELDGCEQPRESWKYNLNSLQEQQCSEPSL